MRISFNGAATCSLRNGIARVVFGEKGNPLQWGRNLFVAEWATKGGAKRFVEVASMGPQLVRCGMWHLPCSHDNDHQRFNGAATCSLRNELQALMMVDEWL